MFPKSLLWKDNPSDTQDLQRNPETRSDWIEYSAFDAEATWHVRKELESLLNEMFWTEEEVNGTKIDRTMWNFYQRYYRDFGQLLVNMENRGIRVDMMRIDSYQIDVDTHLPEVEKEAQAALEKARSFFLAWVSKVGGPDLARLNVNSTAQIQQLLFAPSTQAIVF